MDFSAQLDADLNGVFFSDFKDSVEINGVPVDGRLSRMPHSFENVSGSSYFFEAPASVLSAVKKNDSLVRVKDGKAFAVRSIEPENQIIRLMLS